MADEVATAVDAVQDTATDSAPVEQKLEVVNEGADLNPNDFRETDDREVEADAKSEPVAETQSEAPKGDEQTEGDKPLSPKAENRFQSLANDNRELKQQIEQLRAREAQLANEQDLLGEVNPDTGDYYSPQEVERMAFQQSRQTQAQQASEQRYALEVQANQMTINNEAEQVTKDFAIFNPDSPDFNQPLAQQAAELLDQNLIRDPQGEIIGSNLSPYQLYKTIANAYSSSAATAQIKGQQAAEKMLSQADSVTSSAPVKSSTADEAKMSPQQYAKAHGLKTVWQ